MKKRIYTGDRPTGKLHLGHYVGTLANRVKLQNEYEMFVGVVDLHAITTKPSAGEIELMQSFIHDLVLDYLSVGIDPKKTTILLQSSIPEVTYLSFILSMVVSVARLEHLPTLKEMMDAAHITNPSLGFLTYPVLMAADILSVRADLVPVGQDQLPHIEITREIARSFNNQYGGVFPIPDALIPKGIGTLPGIDGKAKMSKSLNNAIFLTDSKDEVKAKVMLMYTDPTRIRATDPGHIAGNTVFTYHDIFNPNKEEVASLKQKYEEGKVSDVEVKEKLILALNNFLDPIREKRLSYEKQKGLVEDILKRGTEKTRIEVQKTVSLVRQNLGFRFNL